MMKKEKSLSKLFLYIDTSAETTHLALFENIELLDEIFWVGKGELTEVLLKKVDKLLLKNQKTKEQLNTILVFPGPGSYTGLRVGITVANFLAWSLKIAIAAAEIKDKKLMISNSENYILPEYFSDPHITKPKKNNFNTGLDK